MIKPLAAALAALLFVACSDIAVLDTSLNPVYVDSFVQLDSVEGLDIVWFIDQSCSMQTQADITRVASGVEAMMSELTAADINWRLSMTSTSEGGVSQDSFFPLMPGDTIADAMWMLGEIDPAPQEEGLDAGYSYIADFPGRFSSHDWMRWGAGLVYVMVSDEEDYSSLSPADFASWVISIKDSFYLAVIINKTDSTNNNCLVHPPDVGHRYMDTATQLGGVIVDFCTGDWARAMSDLSVAIVEPRDRITLTYTPVQETLMVTVNNVESWDWIYLEPTNEVLLTLLPAPGDFVSAAYQYLE